MFITLEHGLTNPKNNGVDIITYIKVSIRLYKVVTGLLSQPDPNPILVTRKNPTIFNIVLIEN